MMHIHINTTDLRWAIAYAGALISAKSGTFARVNKPFTISFEKTTPEISRLADYFHPKPEDAVDYQIPVTPEFQNAIDHFAAYNHKMELEEQHGIIQDVMVQVLNMSALACQSLLYTHGIVSKAGYFYPKFSPKELRDYDYNMVITNTDYLDAGKAFLEGYGIEPKIFIVTDMIEGIKAVNSLACKAYVGTPNEPMFHVLRSWYEGYDKMSMAIPVVSIIKEDLDPSERTICSWSSHIPVFNGDSMEIIKEKGAAWKTREKYNFDHHAWQRDQAKK